MDNEIEDFEIEQGENIAEIIENLREVVKEMEEINKDIESKEL